MSLQLTTQRIHQNGDSVYCMTPDSYDAAEAELERIGYDTALRETQSSIYGLTSEQIAIGGSLGWTGQLQSAYVGVCLSCKRYISNSGIQTHGHRCELCGAITYLEFMRGSRIRFEFTAGEYRGFFKPELSMTVHEWDTEEGYMYLDYEFHERGISTVTGDEAEALLARHPEAWEMVEKKGDRYLKVPYALRIPMRSEQSDVIRVTDSFGDYRNFKTIALWDLHEYSSRLDNRVPLPSFVYLNRAWEWAPLNASPTLYKSVLAFAGCHDNVNQYEQWLELMWSRETYRKMAAFVRDFTSLDSSGWYQVLDRMPRDPIIGIEAVRHLCWPTYEPRVLPGRRALGQVPSPWGR